MKRGRGRAGPDWGVGEVLATAGQLQSFLLLGGLLPVLTLRCLFPVSGPTHPSGKGEHLRSTNEGLGLWVWADGLGTGWDRGRKSHRNSFLGEAQRLPPLPGPHHRLPGSSFPVPPGAPPVLAPSLLFRLKPLFCTCQPV